MRESGLATIAALGMGMLAMVPGGTSAFGAAITAQNVVIYRVGDGAAALGTGATAVFLDEYTPTGTLVQSIPVPSTGPDSLTAVGTATSEGIISLSQNGATLLFTGYRKDAGGTSPANDAPATTNRVIASVGINGVVSTSLASTDANGTIRSATTVDGTTLYLGTSAGIRYVASPGTAATSTVIDTRNSRQVNLSGDTLYASNGSTAITAKVQSYGILPTGATTPTAVVNLATTDAVNSFALFDLSPDIAGDDTLFVVSQVESIIRKYSFDGFNWSEAGSLAFGSANIANIAGSVSGADVNLFMTGPNGLFNFIDTSGFAGTLSGNFPAAIATAGANTAFRGVNLFQVPEPSAAGLATVGLTLGFGTRRRRSARGNG